MPFENIDICLTRSGKLVLLSMGESADDRLTVSLLDGYVEISGKDLISRAKVPDGFDIEAMFFERKTVHVVLMNGGKENLFDADVVQQEV